MTKMTRYVLVAVLALTLPHFGRAQDKGIRIEREIILERGEPFEPTSITVLPDNDLLVTGSSYGLRSGIASRLRQSGEVVWTYGAKQTLTREGLFGIFRGSIALASGDILVCGNDYLPIETVPHGGYTARLIRLDAAGKFLTSAHLVPPSAAAKLLPYVDGCGRWGEGGFLYGRVFESSPNPALPGTYSSAMSVWLARLDARGEIAWQKLLSTEDRDIVNRPVPSGDDLVFSTGRINPDPSPSSGTLIMVSPDGQIKARRKVIELHTLVEDLRGNFSGITAIRPAGGGVTGMVYVRFDTALNILEERPPRYNGVGWEFPFLRHDDLVLFGFLIDDRGRARGASRFVFSTQRLDRLIDPWRTRGSDRFKVATALPGFKRFAVGYTSNLPEGGPHAMTIRLVAVD